MKDINKVKLVLIAFCMVPIAYSVGSSAGAKTSIQQLDQEAFNDYVDFAQRMKVQTHKHTQPKADDVFARAGF